MFSLITIIILGCFICALSLAVAAAENVVAVKNLELEGSNHHNALVHVSSIPTSSVFVCAKPSSTTTCYICGSITGSSNGYTTYVRILLLVNMKFIIFQCNFFCCFFLLFEKTILEWTVLLPSAFVSNNCDPVWFASVCHGFLLLHLERLYTGYG